MTILSSKHYLRLAAVHPTIATELGALTDLAIRDFVREWFSKCSDDNAFVNDVKTIALDIVGTLSKHLTRLKTVSFIAGDVTESSGTICYGMPRLGGAFIASSHL